MTEEEVKRIVLETIIEITRYYEPPSTLESLNEDAKLELIQMGKSEQEDK